jgi:two-component system, OmpR family, sensor kinase
MMRSLRARLTLAYASLVAAALIVVAVLGTRLEFEALAHPTLDAVETSVRIAETIVAAHPDAPPGVLEGEIAAEARRDGVIVRVPPPNRGLGTGALPEPPRNVENLSVTSLLGLRPHTVRVGPDTVIIAPDLQRLRPALNTCGTTLAVSVVVAIAIAWAFARWLTGLAIKPLLTVTSELRRFAGGDFTPREVRTADREELGALIAAYNGATAKVAEAFEERRDVEQHMRRFVADAGHELRTPLTTIDGYLQILRKAQPDDLALRERALATLQAQTARMRALVERLMLLARLERPAPSQAGEIDVARVAAEAIADVTAARGGRVVLDASPLPPVVADDADVHEAIENLVDNAIKYGAGSEVRVTLAARDGLVVVRVRDGGPGIPADERERVFERFFRGDGRGEIEGSGLGLAIVERAVARCGGRVVLERAEPGETTFALEYPASRARVPDATPLEV